MSWIRFHPFLHVQMIFIDILNTPLKRNIVMNSYTALQQYYISLIHLVNELI